METKTNQFVDFREIIDNLDINQLYRFRNIIEDRLYSIKSK